ncbi:hypothetical protein ACP70R_022595 [Stipagrostis hirtigluma subsp. patula]
MNLFSIHSPSSILLAALIFSLKFFDAAGFFAGGCEATIFSCAGIVNPTMGDGPSTPVFGCIDGRGRGGIESPMDGSESDFVAGRLDVRFVAAVEGFNPVGCRAGTDVLADVFDALILKPGDVSAAVIFAVGLAVDAFHAATVVTTVFADGLLHGGQAVRPPSFGASLLACSLLSSVIGLDSGEGWLQSLETVRRHGQVVLVQLQPPLGQKLLKCTATGLHRPQGLRQAPSRAPRPPGDEAHPMPAVDYDIKSSTSPAVLVLCSFFLHPQPPLPVKYRRPFCGGTAQQQDHPQHSIA